MCVYSLRIGSVYRFLASSEGRLVNRLVFVSATTILVDEECFQNVRKIKPPAFHRDSALEVGAVVHLV